nr:cyclophilin-like fold protein [uncultured Carboxylicivirga sp.]
MKRSLLIFFVLLLIVTESCSKENETQNSTSNEIIDTGDTDNVNQTTNKMKIKIGERILTATLVDNSSTEALVALLKEQSLTIEMRDYANMEKVGSIGQSLPRNDQQITAQSCDIILYQGNALVIYYAPNSWNFTRLGRIDDITTQELKKVLGEGDVTVTLSL